MKISDRIPSSRCSGPCRPPPWPPKRPEISGHWRAVGTAPGGHVKKMPNHAVALQLPSTALRFGFFFRWRERVRSKYWSSTYSRSGRAGEHGLQHRRSRLGGSRQHALPPARTAPVPAGPQHNLHRGCPSARGKAAVLRQVPRGLLVSAVVFGIPCMQAFPFHKAGGFDLSGFGADLGFVSVCRTWHILRKGLPSAPDTSPSKQRFGTRLTRYQRPLPFVAPIASARPLRGGFALNAGR